MCFVPLEGSFTWNNDHSNAKSPMGSDPEAAVMGQQCPGGTLLSAARGGCFGVRGRPVRVSHDGWHLYTHKLNPDPREPPGWRKADSPGDINIWGGGVHVVCV